MQLDISKIPTAGEVPEAWAYTYYLGLKEPLDGRRIRLRSIFNKERTPSMFLFVDKGKYKWKDFSSGKFGENAATLLQYKIFEESGDPINYGQALKLMRLDYAAWCRENGEFIPETLDPELYAYDVIYNGETREFSLSDNHYWSKYGISTDLLRKYHVHPLKKFKLGRRVTRNGLMEIKWYSEYSSDFTYGFFDQSKKLIKIYNPRDDNFKHITICNDILGLDQLENKFKTLVICSSLKDMLALKSLNLDLEVIAPPSEKAIIKAEDMGYLKEIYTHILAMFDNDKTGIRAMMLYKSLYDVDYLYVPGYKDFADFRAYEDELWVKHEIVRRINKQINKCTSQSNPLLVLPSEEEMEAQELVNEEKGHRWRFE